ncbi:NAD-dependent epimerase/dehydratase family protein [Niveispirillum sp. KHB5.9]|uniref:NAD-dependent epimerase/dehydratase family protein n=1 Tax=Niveispirillum sp. KHB5.9 TaxID=3400269 RepID=UPI003A87A76E
MRGRVVTPAAATTRWAGRKVLITGGMGFIGSTLAHRLADLAANVTILDNLTPSHGANPLNIAGIEDRLRVEIADLRHAGHLDHLVRDCEIIFNLAGQTSHLESMVDPFTDLDINCAGQLRLLEACRLHNPGVKLVYSSTRQIYGRPDSLPVDEKHPPHPVDINGINKMAAEWYHRLYHRVYGLRTIVLRLTNTYGPRMRIRDAHQTFLGLWIRLVLEGHPLAVWGGAQLRDFTYVDDCVDALLMAADNPAVEGGVFNIGGDRAISLAELAGLLISANGSGNLMEADFPPEQARIHIGDYQADDGAFRAATGWTPSVPLEVGLRRSLDYFRSHHAGYV